MPEDPANEVLHIHIPGGDRVVRVADLSLFVNRLRKTLSALAREIEETETPVAQFAIVESSNGSFNLGLQTVSAPAGIKPGAYFETFARDLADIPRSSFRRDLTEELINEYRELVKYSADFLNGPRLQFRETTVVMDAQLRDAFQLLPRASAVPSTKIVGRIEGIRTHRVPYTFSLYPKLSEFPPIVCEFPETWLAPVADLLKRRVLTAVEGVGHYRPLDLYPHRMELTEIPAEAVFDETVLTAAIRNLDLLPKGVDVTEYLAERDRTVDRWETEIFLGHKLCDKGSEQGAEHRCRLPNRSGDPVS